MRKTALALALILGLCLCGCGQQEAQKISATFAQDNVSVQEGQSVTVDVQTTGDVTQIGWYTSSAAIVTVSYDNGKVTVTGVAAGSAQIRARFGEELLDRLNVTVIPPPKLLSVRLPEAKLILSVGQTATVKALREESLVGQAVFTSDDPAVASVLSQGDIVRVTAVKAGTCTVTVTVGSESERFTVTVL